MYNQFKDIFETHFDGLVDFAFFYTQNKEVAEDLVQQVFLNIWENKRSSLNDERIKFYLYSSVKNRCFNHIRDSKKMSQEELDKDILSSNQPDIIESIEGKEMSNQINSWINELPPACKRVFLLSRREELTHKEISELLNISTKTIENQITKALKYLRSKIN